MRGTDSLLWVGPGNAAGDKVVAAVVAGASVAGAAEPPKGPPSAGVVDTATVSTSILNSKYMNQDLAPELPRRHTGSQYEDSHGPYVLIESQAIDFCFQEPGIPIRTTGQGYWTGLGG